MKDRAALPLLIGILAALAAGVGVLFHLRLAQGDVFPPYSSLRADPLGTRALHDALGQVPGVRVERQFKPISELEPRPPRTLIFAGLPARGWARIQRDDFDAVDAAVRAGSRVVLAFRAAAARDAEERADEREAEERARKRRRQRGEEETPKIAFADPSRRWGVALNERVLADRGGGAARAAGVEAALPDRVAWRSDLFFRLEANAGWRVLYRRGGEPVLAERSLGLGSLVVAADSYFLSNEALQKDRAAPLLAWMVGPHGRVVFDEAHLGVVAQPGVAALARRYGLSGAFFTLLLLAALYVWRRMALFVPPAQSADDVALTYHPAAGLESLLRRAVEPAELANACAVEWKPTARASERARVDAALAVAAKDASPVDRYNAVVKALKKSEVRGQKPEAKNRRSEVRGQKSEVS